MKKAILYIGLPGSGKTTHLHNSNIDGYKVVSADELKQAHPDYNPLEPEPIHKWSVIEAEKLMNKYSDEGLDICMDSGGVNKSYSLRIISMLKKKGYQIRLIHMDTPLDVCLERNRNRERQVPEDGEHGVINKSLRINSCVKKQKELVDVYQREIYTI